MTRGRVKLLARTSTLLALLLCASCTTVSAELPPPRKCSKYTDPFLEDTKHAPAPADAASKSWVGFAVAEAGKLEQANDDKRKAKHVQGVCETETQEAFDRASRRLKRWYKKIF